MTGPLDPAALAHAAIWEEALELADLLVTEPDPNLVADYLELVAGDANLAHTVLSLLVIRLRQPDAELGTGVELANAGPPPGELILPPGTHR